MSGHVELNELQATLSARPAAMPRARTHLLAELATGYAHAGLPNEGLEAVREALHLTHLSSRSFERAEVMNAAALCHYFRRDCMRAIAGGLDAYQGFLQYQDFANMGHALTTFAAACKDIGATEIAIDAGELHQCRKAFGRCIFGGAVVKYARDAPWRNRKIR